MAYNFNPKFANFINKESLQKHTHTLGYESKTPYASPGSFELKREKSEPSLNFINKDNFEENVRVYKLEEIDHPNGWDFKEIDMLGEMGFRIDDEYKMYAEIDVPSLKMENEKVKTLVYKTDEGYTLETNRKYVFENFEKMLEFIDSVPMGLKALKGR